MLTTYDLVWMAAERAPDHPAIVDDRTVRRLTYRQLMAEIDDVAAGLARRGIGQGTRVATVLPSTFGPYFMSNIFFTSVTVPGEGFPIRNL